MVTLSSKTNLILNAEKKRKNEAGFSLVEIMVAILFLTTIAIAVGQAILAGQQGSQQVVEEATILANCEDQMRVMSTMDMDTLEAQNDGTFSIDGVKGSGRIVVTRPFLSSDDIAKVELYWDNGKQEYKVLEGAFGNPAMVPQGQ